MDRSVLLPTLLMTTAIFGCTLFSKKPEKVLDLRDVQDYQSCPIHHVELEEGSQRIKYAHISKTYDYMEARNQLFPLAFQDITDDEATVSIFRFCPECRKAREEWLDEKLNSNSPK